MAAPNMVEPTQPGNEDDDQGSGPSLSESDSNSIGGLDESARLRHIAQLSEKLAAIESRDRQQVASRATDAAAPMARPGARSGGPARSAGAIGSSGSTRSQRQAGVEPGGHPGDDKGDPESVARAICLRLLAVSARPRAGLATALRQRGVPDEVADRVLDRFVEVGLIDDVAYAEAFVAAKHRERALGVSALRMELRRKGVADHTVDAAVSVLDQDAERQRATALISRRVDAAMNNGPVAARRRLVALLARRGYSAELACQVVDAALSEYESEQDEGWLD